MFAPLSLLFAMQEILLHAPSAELTSAYKLKETITTQFGTIVMTGVETRKVGKPIAGKRAVYITFDVKLADKQLTGKNADAWAQEELRELQIPDSGTLDDHDRLTLSDGVSADAYPIFAPQSIKVGGQWVVSVNGVDCHYTLDKVESGTAYISTDSHSKTRQGTALRSGTWRIDTKTGRLLSWHLRSEVTYRGGSREIVDSSAQLQP